MYLLKRSSIVAIILQSKFIVALFQKKIMAGIDSLCTRLPEPAAKLCKEEVDKMLPLAITFVTGMAVSWEARFSRGGNIFNTDDTLCTLQKPVDICKMLGLCSSGDQQEKMLSYFITEALQAAVKSENVSHI